MHRLCERKISSRSAGGKRSKLTDGMQDQNVSEPLDERVGDVTSQVESVHAVETEEVL